MQKDPKILQAIEMFDPVAWLDSVGISYSYSGKNISGGWLGINCPFCGDDPHRHLGINLNSNSISCWRDCKTKGTVLKLILKVENKGFHHALHTLRKFKRYSHPGAALNHFNRSEIQRTRNEVEKQFNTTIDGMNACHQDFLIARNFDPEYVTRKYQLEFVGPIGNWSYRIAIPVIYGKTTVNYIGRDTTGKKEPKYKFLPNDSAMVPRNELLYNLNTVKDTVIFQEGPLDVWRCGDGFVCTFGVKFTTAQILRMRYINRAFVCFDSDAHQQAEKLANALTTFIPDVQLILLDEGDPADLSEDDVKALRKAVFGKIY